MGVCTRKTLFTTDQFITRKEDLRNRLQEDFGTITPEMVRASKLNLLRRAQLCREMNGGHFEHLL
jgi:hypothetical protein